MSNIASTGRARHLGSAHGLVHCTDKTVVQWSGDAELYLLTPPLRGYTVVVVANNHNAPWADELGRYTDIFGLRGEGLILEWDDVGGGAGVPTIAAALAGAGYTII
jgi:hypothetical protein